MYLADTLSRAYLSTNLKYRTTEEPVAVNLLADLEVTEPRLEEIRQHTANDNGLQVLKDTIQKGWPEQKQEVPPEAVPYFHFRDEMSIHDGIICRGERAIIPQSLRRNMLERIHASHIGVEGCLKRARECLYWPRMNAEVKAYIETCDVCRSLETKQQKETLQSHEIPDSIWSKVGTDLFTFDGRDYMVTVDYYSGFWEVDYLADITSATVVSKLKGQFSRYGIPDLVVSDNAKQFVSADFDKFSETWKFSHRTSSPLYPQSNGKAEAAVKTAKNLMRKAKQAKSDPYLAILAHRNTPTKGMDTSPVQRMMQRRTKTLLPTTKQLLKPKINKQVIQHHQQRQQEQAKHYNKGAKDLPKLKKGDVVRIQPGKYKRIWTKAVVDRAVAKRSYQVITENGLTLRRNRKQLRKTNEQYPMQPELDIEPDTAIQTNWPQPATDAPAGPPAPDRGPRQPATGQATSTTRVGRTVHLPRYLQDYVPR
jgi:hypothetical protein